MNLKPFVCCALALFFSLGLAVDDASAQMFPGADDWTVIERAVDTLGEGPEDVTIRLPLPDGFDYATALRTSGFFYIAHRNNDLPDDEVSLGGELATNQLAGICTGSGLGAFYNGPPPGWCMPDLDRAIWVVQGFFHNIRGLTRGCVS